MENISQYLLSFHDLPHQLAVCAVAVIVLWAVAYYALALKK